MLRKLKPSLNHMTSVTQLQLFRFLLSATIFLVVMSEAIGDDNGTPTLLFSQTLPANQSKVYVRDSRDGSFMPSVANGYVGTVIYSDTIHLAGVYNGEAYTKAKDIYPVYFYQHTHRARIPSSCAIDFQVAGVQGEFSHALDLAEGTFYKWFRADKFVVEERIYAHRFHRHLLVVEISVNNSLGRDVTLEITNNRGNASVDIKFETMNITFPDLKAKAMAGKVNQTEEAGSTRAHVAVVWTEIPTELTVKKTGKPQTWYFITAVTSSLDTKFDPLDEAVRFWTDAVRNAEGLLATHKKAWKSLWSNGRVDIEGNLELAQSVHSSMYYILSSTRVDWAFGLSPGGLPGGEEYMGHTFWDQEIWMYPPLVLLHPDLARAAMRYRHERLPAARRIAEKYGYKGAMFPWESAFTGLQTSPGERYGRYQNHITGDIAFAARQYWMITKDYNWLRDTGFDLIYETAKFWASRVEYDKIKKRYVIKYVMPPDEYQFPVNNSVYTNVVAKLNLESAIELGRLLGKDIPEKWIVIAEKMFIPFDEVNNYHPEFEGYELNVTVKQADTILIGYPLMYKMDRQVRYNDVRLYEERTNPKGPAMTHSMFAIGWLELGEKAKATKPFFKNYDNIQGPFKVWSEIRLGYGAANFITGAGGFLQAVIYGYGGFRIGPEDLTFNPTLPPTTTKMTIRGVSYRGNKIDFVVEEDVKISLVSQNEISPALEVILDGSVYPLEHGKIITLPQKKAILRMRKPLSPKPTLKAKACDHTPHFMCIFFLASLCLYFIIRDICF